MAFPLYHHQMAHDGLLANNQTEIIFLRFLSSLFTFTYLCSRSAWVGSQRYGAAVWSGDIQSTFEELAIQVKVAQNILMSGIGWYDTHTHTHTRTHAHTHTRTHALTRTHTHRHHHRGPAGPSIFFVSATTFTLTHTHSHTHTRTHTHAGGRRTSAALQVRNVNEYHILMF